MAPKSEVGGAQKEAPPKTPKKAKEKNQRERFIEAAREVGVDETGKEFERAIGKIVPPRKGRSKR